MNWNTEVIEFVEALDWGAPESMLNDAMKEWVEKREKA